MSTKKVPKSKKKAEVKKIPQTIQSEMEETPDPFTTIIEIARG
jgi:hypothetical protein